MKKILKFIEELSEEDNEFEEKLLERFDEIIDYIQGPESASSKF